MMVAVLTVPTVGAAQGWNPNAVSEARATIADFLEKDSGLQVYFDEAYAYAVFPGIGKGAFIVGGAHGNGIVFRNGDPIGSTSLTQATVGFSLGGQKFAEVIFFQNEAAFERFPSDNLELAAQASAVIVRQGGSADADYEGGVADFTYPLGGAMCEASVGGQKFKFTPAGES
jgi:lipid-binding SYLF domain-containing protein